MARWIYNPMAQAWIAYVPNDAEAPLALRSVSRERPGVLFMEVDATTNRVLTFYESGAKVMDWTEAPQWTGGA